MTQDEAIDACVILSKIILLGIPFICIAERMFFKAALRNDETKPDCVSLLLRVALEDVTVEQYGNAPGFFFCPPKGKESFSLNTTRKNTKDEKLSAETTKC